MTELIFRCPATNRMISSGIVIEPETADTFQRMPVRVRCVHCRGFHQPLVADAELRRAA